MLALRTSTFLFWTICTVVMTPSREQAVNSMMYMPEAAEEDTSPGMLQPYDSYGAPPDHYPVIIPGPEVPSDYYDNITYPGLYDDTAECQSITNCPWEFPSGPADPYVGHLHGGAGFAGDERPPKGAPVPEGWKCIVEADCFAQDAIPRNLSQDTEVLFLRSYTFRTIGVGNLSVLPPLKRLRIEYSDLQTIDPGAFASQIKLEALELEGNDIADIMPSTFAELSNLKQLDLSNNELTDLDHNMFIGLDQLKLLSLSSNNLLDVPNRAFSYLPQLEDLNLEYNNITYIAPYAFGGLRNLKTLSLNYNFLTSVPNDALRVPPSLSNLHLSGNFIRSVSKSDFRGLDKLTALWLDECSLETMSKGTFKNKKIKTLVLSLNNLKTLPNLGSMPRLRTLNLDENPWHCDCRMWPGLKWLRRQGLISPLPNMECRTPQNLQGQRALNLDQNDLCQAPPLLPELSTKTPQPAVSPVLKAGSQAMTKGPEAATVAKSTDVLVSNSYDYSPGTYYYGETYSEKDTALPEGGWSNVPYDTKKLYTVVERESTTTQTLHQNIPTAPNAVYSTQRMNPETTLLTKITGSTGASRPKLLRSTTEQQQRDSSVDSQTLDTIVTSAHVNKQTLDTIVTSAHVTKLKTTTTTTTHPNVGAGTGMPAVVKVVIAISVIAVTAVFAMVLAAKALAYKRHIGTLNEKKSNDLKLKLSVDGGSGVTPSVDSSTNNNNKEHQNGHTPQNS